MLDEKESRDYRKNLMKRFIRVGLEGLLENEILELFLILTKHSGDVRPVAASLMRRYKDLRRLHDAPIEELVALPGISVQTAILLKAIKSCSEYYLKERVRRKNLVSCGLDLVKYCRMSMAEMRDEVFKTIFLNIQGEILEIETINTGTVDQSMVYPRKIIERAIFHNAVGLIFAHNHPGGDTKPSYADKELTTLLTSAAAVMDIEVYDHLIIGQNGYFSFRDAGLIMNNERSFTPVVRMSINSRERLRK